MGVDGVAITGVAGFLGQGLLRRLAGVSPGMPGGSGVFPGIRRIIGLDIADPAFRPRELQMRLVDVTRADLTPLLDGVEMLVHLAGVHDAIPDEDLMARVNVAGTRRVLEAAGAAGVGKVILVSSATVYGAWPNNPIPLNEDAPLRPNPGFPLAAHKAEAERLLAEWVATHPEAVATVLRLATVVGPRADHALARMLRSRLPLGLAGATAPVQFLHEQDAVEALALAMTTDLPGAYNVAADGWLSRDDLRGVLGRRFQPGVAPELAGRIMGRLWPAGLVDLPPSVIPYLVHPWVVAIDRLRAAGWSPAHSNEEAVLACAEFHPRPARAKLATAVGVGAGLAAAGMIAGARRRHR
jgi:nucleoside-diphosphate-sugar epimerase